MYKFLKTLHPGGIWTLDHLFIGGHDDLYATPPGPLKDYLHETKLCRTQIEQKYNTNTTQIERGSIQQIHAVEHISVPCT
jgi:hypothetical protein